MELVALCWLNPAWQTDQSVALLCSLAFGLGSAAIILAEKGTGSADCFKRKVSSLNNFAIANSGATEHCSLLVTDERVFPDSTKVCTAYSCFTLEMKAVKKTDIFSYLTF